MDFFIAASAERVSPGSVLRKVAILIDWQRLSAVPRPCVLVAMSA